MPSADDVYITPADRKIDFYQSSAIAASISGSAADDLVLYTNGNSDQLVLDNGGNVGIGTNAPGETLHIVGTGRFTSSLAVGNTTQPTSTGLSVSTTIQVAERSSAPSHIDTWGVLWVKNDDPTNLYFTDDDGNDIALTNNGSPAGGGGGDIGGTVSAGYIPYASSGDTLANALLFTSGATESMYIGATPGTLNAANYNTTLGYQAGDDMTEGDENTLIGQAAGANITTGDANTMIGRNTGHALTTTSNNTFIGSQAGQNVATSYNTLVGALSGYNTGGALGSYNNFFGFGAGQNIQGAAQKNVAIGVYALYGNTSNTSATANNVAIGHEAMKEIEGGYSNIGIGTSALLNVTSGYQNIGIGSNAGDSISTAARNVIIGASAVEGSNTDESIIIGAYAGFATTTAIDSSVIIGTYAAQNASPSNAVILGRQAGYYASGAGNTYMGYQSGFGDASTNGGTYNTAVGYEAMEKVQDADENVAVGSQALWDNTSGDSNVAIGGNALYRNTTANHNVAVGHRAMFTSTTAAQNVSIGKSTLYALTDGDNNVAIGYKAGYDMTTGTENVLVGPESGENMTDAGYNVAIGSDALKTSTSASYSIAIGKNAMSSGDVSANKHTIGIGYNAMANASTSSETVMIGSYAGDAVTTGGDNTGVGHAALSTIAGGAGNTAVGREAMRDIAAGSNYNTGIGTGVFGYGGGTQTGNVGAGWGAGYYPTGNYNVFMGFKAGYGNVSTKSAHNNVAIGSEALMSITSGDDNVAVGYQAAYDTTTGYENIYIGKKAGENVTTANRSIYIGSGAGAGNVASAEYGVYIGQNAGGTAVSGMRNTIVGGGAGANGYAAMNETTLVGYAAGVGVSGANNTFIGASAGNATNAAINCVAVGTALRSITGSSNVAVGYGAMADGAGSAASSVAVGARALQAVTTGVGNTAIGKGALQINTTQSYNTTVGDQAGYKVNTASNTIMGARAGEKLAGGSGFNTHIGAWSGRGDSDTYSGSYNTTVGAYTMGDTGLADANYNTIVGFEAGKAITGGDNNTLIGVHAGNDLTTGEKNTVLGTWAFASGTSSYNTILGYSAGNAITSGEENTIIGYNAGDALTTTNYNVFIGNGAAEFATTVGSSVAIGRQAMGAAAATGDDNVAVGYRSMYDLTTGVENVAVGHFSLPNVTSGSYNVAMGRNALNVLAGGKRNTAIGYGSMYHFAEAGDNKNTAIGMYSFYKPESGSNNTAVGYQAGYGEAGVDGDGNTYLGASAGYEHSGTNNNTAVGYQAMYGTNGSFTGDENVAMGVSAMLNVTSGHQNVALGYQAGLGFTSGENNIAIGYRAGYAVTTGTGNVFIGYQAGNNTDNDNAESDKLVIANSNTTTPLIDGDFGGILTFNVTGNAPNSLTVTANQSSADGILIDSYEPRIVMKNRRSSGNDSVAIRYDNATPSLQIRTSRDSYAVPMAIFNDDGATFGINAAAWGAGVAIASGASYSLDNTTSNRITRVSGKIDYLSTDTHVFNNPITVTGSVRPGTDNTYDLGTATLRWNNAYFDDGFIEINKDGATTDLAGAGRFWVSGTTPYFNNSNILLGGGGDVVTAADGRWTDGNSTLAPLLMSDYGAVANAASNAGTAAYLYWNNTTSTLHPRNLTVGSAASFPADTTGVTASASDNSTKFATTAYVDAAAGGGGGISWDGSTANGIATYKDADEATVESNFTFDGTTATISSATSMKPTLMIKNTNTDSGAGELQFYKSTTSEGDDDNIGSINFYADNDAAEKTQYARIRGMSKDMSDATEDGRFEFHAMQGGTLTGVLEIGYDGNSNGINMFAGGVSGSGLSAINYPDMSNVYLQFGSDGSYSSGSNTWHPAGFGTDGNPDPNDSGGSQSLYMRAQSDISITAGSGGKDAGNASADITFNTASGSIQYVPAERMRIRGDGYVGIGTSAPSMKLQVVDTDHEVAEFESSHSAGASIKIDATSTGGTHWKFQSTADGSSHGGGKLSIQKAGANKVVIDGDGLVGINTTSPTDLLTIQGDTNASTQVGAYAYSATNDKTAKIFLNKSANSTAGSHTAVADDDVLGLLAFRGSDGDSYEIGAQIRGQATQDFAAGARGTDLIFSTVDNSTTTLDDRMVIAQDGKVGINTAAPQQQLHVEGGFRFRDGNSSSQRLEGYGWNDNFALVVSGSDALGLCGGTPGVRFLDGSANTHLQVTESSHLANVAVVSGGAGIVYEKVTGHDYQAATTASLTLTTGQTAWDVISEAMEGNNEVTLTLPDPGTLGDTVQMHYYITCKASAMDHPGLGSANTASITIQVTGGGMINGSTSKMTCITKTSPGTSSPAPVEGYQMIECWSNGAGIWFVSKPTMLS